jgi:hypothetical protein
MDDDEINECLQHLDDEDRGVRIIPVGKLKKSMGLK